ncbi:DoxX family membrane protein [Haoranjiania flava]|uniref:DoxX family protein n=1 Tax=Haoranjiania flava TaxID=1856322 RepID=A0AAE3ING1_9BACT|nr:DoxX family protein [Haoranjiania flava]MCU7695290.1 DoxX family protein [Haoranjiania flava]
MKTKILFVLCLLCGLMFINSGLNKFLNYLPVPGDLPEKVVKMNMAIMEIIWLMPLVGVVEIIGGILFIIPRFRALGAIVLFPVMVGILLTHITVAPSGLPMALIIFAIILWVMIKNREKYLTLIR